MSPYGWLKFNILKGNALKGCGGCFGHGFEFFRHVLLAIVTNKNKPSPSLSLASLLRRDKTTRHSREGGNPSSYTYLQSLWIPAFAGMTDFLNVLKLSQLKREALSFKIFFLLELLRSLPLHRLKPCCTPFIVGGTFYTPSQYFHFIPPNVPPNNKGFIGLWWTSSEVR